MLQPYIAIYQSKNPTAYREETIQAASWLTARAKAFSRIRQGEQCISVEMHVQLPERKIQGAKIAVEWIVLALWLVAPVAVLMVTQ